MAAIVEVKHNPQSLKNKPKDGVTQGANVPRSTGGCKGSRGGISKARGAHIGSSGTGSCIAPLAGAAKLPPLVSWIIDLLVWDYTQIKKTAFLKGSGFRAYSSDRLNCLPS